MGATRDYYADLDLPPTAEVQDIKKQFRKLALKYHPDRNPGKEQEVNVKFQIIQSAHEVLSDPEQKAKYDATRTRSRYPGASGKTGNPWSNAGNEFPPPPRRNQPARPTPSGAQRYTRFAQGVPPTAKQNTASNPDLKQNAARAFENMRKPQPTTKPAEQPRPEAPPPPPRTEGAKQRAQASFGTRKTGYHPRSATHGDEPPVASSNYNTNYNTKPASEHFAQDIPHSAPIPDPFRQFREKDKASGFQQSNQNANSSNGKTHTADGVPLDRATSTRDSSPSDASSPGVDTPRRQQSFGTKSKNAEESTSNSQTFSQGPEIPTKIPMDTRPKAPLKKTRTGPKLSSATDASTSKPGPSGIYPQNSAAGEPSIFSFPVNDDTFAPTSPEHTNFSKSSTDDINTRFVNEEEPDSWQFSAGGSEQGTPTKPRPPPGARTGRRSPVRRPTIPRSETSSVAPESGTSESGFNPEGWTKEFGPHTFQAPPSQAKPASPTRSMRGNSRKGRSVKTPGATTVDDDHSSSEDEEEELAWGGRKAQLGEPFAADSPQAMDIDSPPAKPTTPPKDPKDQDESLNGARNIPLEPSRPEWRPGNVAGVVNGEAKPKLPPKIPFNPNAAGSEDSEEFMANFSELKNVAPFAQQSSGLKSFAELKDNLPFESQASAEPPVRIPKAQPLVFPSPPTAPPLPSVAINGRKPHIAAWEKYVKEFESYLQQWDEFNARVVDHFSTRKTNITNFRKTKGYSFLEARSDADIQEYFSWVQQDSDVRAQWNAACLEHEHRFREFMAFRLKMK